mgnify:FL=1|jgi:AcrR family transcriptional regulator
MASSKREQVLKCARELFEREGFHATGVDRILEKAGVAKMTLYNNFGSKDQLIVEVLNQSSEIMIGRMKEHALAASNDSYEQILAIFRTLGDSYQDPDFCGCMFQAAVAEFPDHDSAPAQAALAHHRRLTEIFLELCTKAGLKNPEELSRKLALLSSGASCVARQTKARTPADDALCIAEILLERASN